MKQGTELGQVLDISNVIYFPLSNETSKSAKADTVGVEETPVGKNDWFKEIDLSHLEGKEKELLLRF